MFRLRLLTPEPWMESGLCRQTDPDLWYAEKGQWEITFRAKKVCQGCPVIRECLSYALENNEMHGVWGGMTPENRKALRRQSRAAS